MDKKKIITDFEKLSKELQDLYKKEYADGIEGRTVKFPNIKGEIVTAVRLETEESIYLVKISAKMKEVFTEEQLDAMVKPSEKDLEIEGGEEESEDSENSSNTSDNNENEE